MGERDEYLKAWDALEAAKTVLEEAKAAVHMVYGIHNSAVHDYNEECFRFNRAQFAYIESIRPDKEA